MFAKSEMFAADLRRWALSVGSLCAGSRKSEMIRAEDLEGRQMRNLRGELDHFLKVLRRLPTRMWQVPHQEKLNPRLDLLHVMLPFLRKPDFHT